MKENLQKITKFIMKNRQYLFVIGFVLLLFGAILTFIQPAFWSAYNLTNTGQIGDTIGGITAPIINVIGAILVYSSFLEQNRANKIQSEQNTFNLLHELYKELKSELNNLTFATKNVNNGNSYKGSKAQSVFIEILESRIDNPDFSKNSFFKEYLFLMGNITIFLDIVQESNALEKEKKYILRLFHFLYLAKIKVQHEKIIELTTGKTHHADFLELLKDAELKIEQNYTKNFAK